MASLPCPKSTLTMVKIQISHFEVRHDSQFLRLDGNISKLPEDELTLQLNDINLDYIFDH